MVWVGIKVTLDTAESRSVLGQISSTFSRGPWL
ncbi:Uncharacterised protein [Vibrio cholerae]|nr:Uncharacterised protein [Vibrio cholerae]